MNKSEVQQWMYQHPKSIHGAPETIISRCSHDLREKGIDAAWARAKEIVDHEYQHWKGSHGNRASPGFVSREVCRNLAAKLRAMEPVVAAGDEDCYLDAETRDALETDAIEKIRPWLHEMATKEEHEEWLRIVEFTKKRGTTIALEEHLSSDAHWKSTWEYGEAAALVIEILSRDFARHNR